MALPAQTAPSPDTTRGPRRGPPGNPNPVVRVLDADRNHEASSAELANAATVLRTLDTNSDGEITVDELRPARPADAPEHPAPPADAPPHARPVDPVMLALNANADGKLSASEIANAPASLAALDLNKDNKLTLHELRPLPPEGAPAAGPRRGAPPPPRE